MNLSAIGRERWVVDKLRYGYDDILSTAEIIRLVTDKYACYCKFKQYYKRVAVGCYDKADLKIFILFVQEHHDFIYKPLGADCGKGVKKVTLSDDDIEVFFNENIKLGSFIVEEIIEQHESMAKIHPQSINTIRVATFVVNERVEVIATSLRMGVGNSIADNAGAGCIFTSIEPETGIVICKACNYMGDVYTKHPDSGIIIPGFQIPAWNELIAVVKEVALKLKDATLISWDFSYSKKGWVIVEVNTGGDWIILQAAQKEPLKENCIS